MTVQNNEEVNQIVELYSDLHDTLNLVLFELWVLKTRKNLKKEFEFIIQKLWHSRHITRPSIAIMSGKKHIKKCDGSRMEHENCSR